MSRRPWIFAPLVLAILSACDWTQFAFMNSIPFKGDPSKNPEVRVYLGIDGLSYYSVLDAQARGAFRGGEWSLAKSIAPFPVTSDANWTRILRTQPIEGYELEYYDPISDRIENPGLLGLVRHIMPVFNESLNLSAPWWNGFDHTGSGYFSSISAYSDVYASLGESLDSLFFLLEGRAETASTFSAYLLEFDVLGHMEHRMDSADALMLLSRKIDQFVRRHPERRFYFTIFSDHGMDFMPSAPDKLVMMDEELPKVGVQAVRTLSGRDPTPGPYAVPVIHTRVSYSSLHTHPSLVEEVAGRVSRLPSVDVAVGGLPAPVTDPGAPRPLEWFGIWADGSLAAYFGFDATTDEYYLPPGQDYARLGLDSSISSGPGFRVIGDDALFALVSDKKYPDLFYRIRTGLSAVGVRYPGQVLVSFRELYASRGFTALPGADQVANEGFHGALSEGGSLGTLLTNETSVPAVVRAESVVDLFPALERHLHQSRGLKVHSVDAHHGLRY